MTKPEPRVLETLRELVISFEDGQLPQSTYMATLKMVDIVLGHEAMVAFTDNVEIDDRGVYVELGGGEELWRKILLACPDLQMEASCAAG